MGVIVGVYGSFCDDYSVHVLATAPATITASLVGFLSSSRRRLNRTRNVTPPTRYIT